MFRRLCVAILGCVVVATAGTAVPAAAAAGSVVINEIHYNPADSFDLLVPPLDVEFLELHNPGDTPVDLSGMSFVGFDLVFPPNTTLLPGAYEIVAPVAADAIAAWGVAPLTEFIAGGISGGGELIQLLAADGTTVVDQVLYDDVAPWPGAPDGNGPSLELINPAFDNADPASWGASLNDIPTPGAQNSIFAELPPPTIENTRTEPTALTPGTPFDVAAEIPDAVAPQVYYTLNIAEPESGPVAMTSDGNGTWRAPIPGQAGGTLVRFRVVDGDLQAPKATDTIDYFGAVVADPDLATTQMKVVQFWVEDSEYDRIYSDKLSEEEIPAVISYGGQVIDNARFRQRGGTSRNFVKRNYKIELPDGYLIDFGEEGHYPLDEFNLQADRGDVPYTQTLVSWDVAAAEGEADIVNFHVRAERNGDFFGLYRIQEAYDGTFRSQNGFDDGEFHKVGKDGWNQPDSTKGWEKKNPDDLDYTAITAAGVAVRDSDYEARTAWAYQNIDIPSVINYSALTALLRHGDSARKNWYAHLDGDTEQWSQMLWDLDQTWLWYSTGPCPDDDLTIPTCLGNPFLNSILEVPELEELYWRRIQTLVD
ncbi:MAG: CotH kinase family protein, partial [Acidimicrobiia bacterium]